ncbi:glycoside hydrolase [Trichodelitschia bisporula]|uniref:non-reducing end alpha-L-arabinofuranosidase n=1 Tax=Trichodelitschia bisporula TaxID=703511 RepID=A0A6G1I9L2_9PEZI|nr:glycoside hydrolase [Trichodelitschia bisporula]
MTTYTKIPMGKNPTITVDADYVIAPITPLTYGGFTEHMGRCIYGGIYDPGNSLSDANGFRTDVIEALKELKTPVVRYPGGNFVATYHWLDGVGPKEHRPKRPELAWQGVESNQFGTDEFMQWCELVGAEPYLCLNFGTGTLDEALGWLEYCNSSADTYYANLRRKNGRENPYNVKYWALGNEVWGPWQVLQSTPSAYSHQAYQWAKALKLQDPSIKLILCGKDGLSSWDHQVLKECVKVDAHGLNGDLTRSLIDMHSIHLYTASQDYVANIVAPRAAERAIQITSGLIDLARIENGVSPSVPKQKICFDEWNVWDPVRAPGELGAEEKYTLSDALAVAVWLNVFIRQAAHIGMATIAQSVNVISPLMTSPTGIHKQMTWWPLKLFSEHMRGDSLAVHVCAPAYEGSTTPAWIRAATDTPWLDVSAARDDDGFTNLAVVNVSPDEDFQTVMNVREGYMRSFTLTAEGMGSVAKEDGIDPIKHDTWYAKGQIEYLFPRHSLTILKF